MKVVGLLKLMKLQLSSMMMANSKGSCWNSLPIDRETRPDPHSPVPVALSDSPTCSAKSRANNDEQLKSIFSSHSWLGLDAVQLFAGLVTPNWPDIQVSFSQIFGFLFQNCSVYCLFGPSPGWLNAWLSDCLAYILNILPSFISFYFLHKKCCLLWTKALLWPFRQTACFPFLWYSKFRFAFFFKVFIVFRTTDWLQYEKDETRAQFSCLVCVHQI